MKRIALLPFVISTLMVAFADTEVVDGIEWTYVSTGIDAWIGYGTKSAISLTTEGDVIVPAQLGSLPVTRFSANAFYGCDKITRISLPPSLTVIGKMAFFNCSNLQEIVWSSDLKTIDDYAFRACVRLSVNNWPTHLQTIGSFAFAYCDALRAALLPNELTSIGYGAFKNSGLHFAELPSGLKMLPSRTFISCTNLVAVTLPEGLEAIGDESFCDCRRLTSVTIPLTVRDIGAGVFEWCDKLSSVSIPHGVLDVKSATFMNCTNLVEVILPSSVTNIGWYAFYKCSKLDQLTMPPSLSHWDENAFIDCAALNGVKIADSESTVEVPYNWISSFYPSIPRTQYMFKLYETAIKGYPVWHDYVSGANPTNRTDTLNAIITIGSDGLVSIDHRPIIADIVERNKRIYTTYGRKSLGDGSSWELVGVNCETNFNFFKVGVKMK